MLISFRNFLIVFLSFLLFVSYSIEARQYLSHQWQNHQLKLQTDEGVFRFTFLTPQAIEVFFQPPHVKQLPSFALTKKFIKVAETNKGNASLFVNTSLKFEQTKDYLTLSSPQLTLRINKHPLQVSYYKNGQLLASEESGFFVYDSIRGVRFKLDKTEKILGGGERVLGMDRRGHRMPLYNRAHYGYNTQSNQMNYSLPAIMSSKKYMILFDNSAKGFLDIGKSDKDILQFEAVAGRTSYIFFSGETYPELIKNYVTVTGFQPLPPRWALGNFASRFGYHTEQEARNVVEQYKQADIPLDAIIFDLYWFGKDLKGYMGYLDWDKKAFPTATKMISDFNAQGVKTIMITEPFVLTNVDKYQDAADNNALALDLAGKPKKYDFYFGNTALIDVFSKQGQDWFWQYYAKLLAQGVEGWWGDLGEPEVHPSDTIHAIGSADEVHNAYGHKWAEMVFTKQLQVLPDKRPFLLMRSGFAGSQRFGMIPWTGDVERSWGGLKPQVELSLQMSLFGLAYTHSDLGGFAGDLDDEELYIRWLQYGVFQPIYRPHAQESVPSEPIFHSQLAQDILRKYIKLRYRLLPYNYTLAYQNSISGMPLMRPLFFGEKGFEEKGFGEQGFENKQDTSLIDIKDSYFWGDAFFVVPITEPAFKWHSDIDMSDKAVSDKAVSDKITQEKEVKVLNLTTSSKQQINLPSGVWFNYFNDKKYQGGKTLSVTNTIETIPVFVRAGAFVPMINDIHTTKEYSSAKLTIHFYADESIKHASYQMYEDDGETYNAQKKGLYELLNFTAKDKNDQLTFDFERLLHEFYQGMPKQRAITFIVHNLQTKPSTVVVDNKQLKFQSTIAGLDKSTSGAFFEQNKKQLVVKFIWQKIKLNLSINK